MGTQESNDGTKKSAWGRGRVKQKVGRGVLVFRRTRSQQLGRGRGSWVRVEFHEGGGKGERRSCFWRGDECGKSVELSQKFF